ncbi:SDR family oxidoreductase [Simiduia aestuariiviva]|uniref:Peroxisomal trans-2-enoyl-CoA reductase n=1 Tax=Simiduia aestuariiviva TaxID=1510459 RepID=A0A839UMZ6_9GAMM|nr:SDR family oxidoreductase [Simiduia aestuariiviva]MBB3168131.1 citronellol/citronellal dehydrogenase [Simiduia aestuariiviva]
MSYQSVLKPDLFKNQCFIVTGGGSGIGRCVAHELSSLGAHVVITGRTQAKLDRVSEEIRNDGGSVSSASFDIRDEVAVTQAIANIITEHPVIHGLVNNAGGQFPAPLELISAKGFEAVVRSNLLGGFLMAREVYKHSMQKHGGAIINITADNLNGMPAMGHSGAARAGMENLTKTCAWEWGFFGVRVNAVAPGWVASSGFDTYDPQFQTLIKGVKDHVPLKRLAFEAEISAAICFLLSPGGAFINGHTLRIDGGSSLGSAPAIWPLPEGPAANSSPFNGFHRAELPAMLRDSENE